MRVFRPLVVFGLAFLWMPLTSHCELEAAGFGTQEPDACCDESETCSRDVCAVVEDGDYLPPGGTMKVPVPGLLACLHAICLRPAVVDPPAEKTAWVEASEKPLDWIGEWHFVRRAAAPPRAPSLNA